MENFDREIQMSLAEPQNVLLPSLLGYRCKSKGKKRKLAIVGAGRQWLGASFYANDADPSFCLRIRTSEELLNNPTVRQEDEKNVNNISSVLRELSIRHNIDFFVDYHYEDNALHLTERNINIPGILMDWGGNTLASVLYPSDGNTLKPTIDQYAKMADDFMSICAKMKEMGIVHGDLSANNITVTPDWKLKLIDYDSLYIPGRDVIHTELSRGTNGYKHPGRVQAQRHTMSDDNFSQLVIYLSLLTYSVFPEMNNKKKESEELLFGTSQLISITELRNSEQYNIIKSSGNQKLIFYLKELEKAFDVPYDKVPFLCDLVYESKEAAMPLTIFADYCGICGHHFENQTDLYCPDCGTKRVTL